MAHLFGRIYLFNIQRRFEMLLLEMERRVGEGVREGAQPATQFLTDELQYKQSPIVCLHLHHFQTQDPL